MNRTARSKLSLSATHIRTLSSTQLTAAVGGGSCDGNCGKPGDPEPKARQTLNVNCNSGRCAIR